MEDSAEHPSSRPGGFIQELSRTLADADDKKQIIMGRELGHDNLQLICARLATDWDKGPEKQLRQLISDAPRASLKWLAKQLLCGSRVPPLHFALRERADVMTVRSILEMNPSSAAVVMAGGTGFLPLHEAVCCEPEVARLVLHAHPSSAFRISKDGRTPLFRAVEQRLPRQQEVVSLLLEANPDAVSQCATGGLHKGSSPLDIAVRNRNGSVLEILQKVVPASRHKAFQEAWVGPDCAMSMEDKQGRAQSRGPVTGGHGFECSAYGSTPCGDRPLPPQDTDKLVEERLKERARQDAQFFPGIGAKQVKPATVPSPHSAKAPSPGPVQPDSKPSSVARHDGTNASRDAGVAKNDLAAYNSNLSITSDDSDEDNNAHVSNGMDVNNNQLTSDGLDTRTPEELQEILGEVKRQLGRGGFGDVYSGYDPLLGAPVAVKLLRGARCDRMFSREAQALSGLNHRNVIRIWAKCEEKKAIIMEMAAGSLQDRIETGDLSCRQRLEVFKDVTLGLRYLHRKELIHRDIKPANILLTDDLTAKITDYGLAKNFHKATGRLVSQDGNGGTPGYQDPYAGQGPPETRDVYSLGVMMLVVMCGAYDRSPIAVLQQVFGWKQVLEDNQENFASAEFDETVCIQMLDRRDGFQDWDSAICRVVLALSLQCVRDPLSRPSLITVHKRLEKCLEVWNAGGIKKGEDLSLISRCMISTADELPREVTKYLSDQINLHLKLIKRCEEKGLNGMEKSNKGELENKFLTLGGLIYYAKDHGVIDERELIEFKMCNNKGNNAKHQACAERQLKHGGVEAYGSSSKAPDMSLVDNRLLSQRNPVIRMVRYHRKLIIRLEDKRAFDGMSKNQQKDIKHIFNKTITFAAEKGVICGEGKRKLRAIAEIGNKAKHDEIEYYCRLEDEYRGGFDQSGHMLVPSCVRDLTGALQKLTEKLDRKSGRSTPLEQNKSTTEKTGTASVATTEEGAPVNESLKIPHGRASGQTGRKLGSTEYEAAGQKEGNSFKHVQGQSLEKCAPIDEVSIPRNVSPSPDGHEYHPEIRRRSKEEVHVGIEPVCGLGDSAMKPICVKSELQECPKAPSPKPADPPPNPRAADLQQLKCYISSSYEEMVHDQPTLVSKIIYSCSIHWCLLQGDGATSFAEICNAITSAASGEKGNRQNAIFWLSNVATLGLLLQRHSIAVGIPELVSPLAAMVQSGEEQLWQHGVSALMAYFYPKVFDDAWKKLACAIEPCFDCQAGVRILPIKWDDVLCTISEILAELDDYMLPDAVQRAVISQLISEVDQLLLNRVLDRKYSFCSSAGCKFMKLTLEKTKVWMDHPGNTNIIGGSWAMLSRIRQAVDLMCVSNKAARDLQELVEICPDLTIEQLYGISTVFKNKGDAISERIQNEMRTLMKSNSAHRPHLSPGPHQTPFITLNDPISPRDAQRLSLEALIIPQSLAGHEAFHFIATGQP